MNLFWASVATTLSLSLGASAQAQTFPSKAIRIVVPFSAGSGSDADSRFYGDILSKRLGQPVVVDNKPGGSGFVAVQAVKSAPPDGHTILLASNSPMAVNPVVMKEMPYDPFKDFKPLTGLTVGPVGFVVRNESPYKTINDLVNAAKREKRPISVGNYSAGYQLVATWLGSVTKAEINHINYRGGAQAMTDVIGGQLEVAVVDPSGALSLVQEGRLRMLATTGDQRYAGLPDVPTMKESGYPEFETYVWSSFFVRSETPKNVTDKLADTLLDILSSEQGKAYQKSRGVSALLLKSEEMRKFQITEYERFKRVAEAAGLQPQ